MKESVKSMGHANGGCPGIRGASSAGLLLFAVLISVHFYTACSWFGGEDPFTAVEALVEQANTKVSTWCEKGYLPPVACDEWKELYALLGENLEYLKSKWPAVKGKIIDYIIRFLAGRFLDSDTMHSFPKPDPSGIFEAAEKAANAGYLTFEDFEALKAAVQ